MSEHVHDKSVDQLNGDSEEEDEELADVYSEMEDERGVFNYEWRTTMRMMGKMTWKRVILVPRMERELWIMKITTTTLKSIRTDTQHTIVVTNIFSYMIPHIVSQLSLQAPLAKPK